MPYTHNIRGIYDMMTMINSLREAGFFLRENEYEFGPPAPKGTKNAGMPYLRVTFRNKQHADHVRLALDGQPIGDGEKIICQRDGNHNQRLGHDPRPEVDPPSVEHIRAMVKRAYDRKRAGSGEISRSQGLVQDEQLIADKKVEGEAEAAEEEGEEEGEEGEPAEEGAVEDESEWEGFGDP